VQKYATKSVASIKGHLKQTRKNQRSTTHTPTPIPPTILPAAAPKTHEVFYCVEQTGKTYSDQTGRFPVTSSRGNKYIMVMYDFDSNSILAEPIKSRTVEVITAAYNKMHNYLVSRGCKPILHRLDNEASAELKKSMSDKQVKFQLVPPHIHRRNLAERAISTFKYHFIAGLASVDSNFPLHLWWRLIPQVTMTLNLLRQSRINPKLSAYAQLEGNFDYNKTPLAPLGIKVVIHEKCGARRTWAPHGVDGWYLGPL
jgi:hypothetical protein